MGGARQVSRAAFHGHALARRSLSGLVAADRSRRFPGADAPTGFAASSGGVLGDRLCRALAHCQLAAMAVPGRDKHRHCRFFGASLAADGQHGCGAVCSDGPRSDACSLEPLPHRQARRPCHRLGLLCARADDGAGAYVAPFRAGWRAHGDGPGGQDRSPDTLAVCAGDGNGSFAAAGRQSGGVRGFDRAGLCGHVSVHLVRSDPRCEVYPGRIRQDRNTPRILG